MNELQDTINKIKAQIEQLKETQRHMEKMIREFPSIDIGSEGEYKESTK